jgi:Tfp pilus assembly protein PilF
LATACSSDAESWFEEAKARLQNGETLSAKEAIKKALEKNPGYAEAYLNDQCIKDSLYSNKCEGYATAYAIKYLVTGIDSTVVNK